MRADKEICSSQHFAHLLGGDEKTANTQEAKPESTVTFEKIKALECGCVQAETNSALLAERLQMQKLQSEEDAKWLQQEEENMVCIAAVFCPDYCQW